MVSNDIIGNLFPGNERPLREDFEVTTSELFPCRDNFLENLEVVRQLLALPFAIGAAAAGRTLEYTIFIEALTKAPKLVSATEALKTPEFRGILSALGKEFSGNNDKMIEFARDIDRELALQLQDSNVALGVEALRLSSVLMLWTTLECFAHDLWVAAIDTQPDRFWKTVCGHGEPDRETREGGKTISTAILARHGFSLAGKLGSVIESKFDFSSIGGLERAYGALVGKDAQSVLQLKRLNTLCAVRNLIAHRGGRIDDKYKVIVGSLRQIGDKIELSGQELKDFIVTVQEVASAILRDTDAAMN